MMKPIPHDLITGDTGIFDVKQFVYPSGMFGDDYFAKRGVCLIGTVGKQTPESIGLGDELMPGNVAIRAERLADNYEAYRRNTGPFAKSKDGFVIASQEEAVKRFNVLHSVLGLHIPILRPIANQNGGGKNLIKFDSHKATERPIGDSAYVDNEAGAAGFSPADCPIVCVAAVNPNNSSIQTAIFHFGYLPVGDGIGEVMANCLKRLKGEKYELYAFISAGISSIEVRAERATPLLQLRDTDEVFKSNSQTMSDGKIVVRLGDYAEGLLKSAGISGNEIERCRIDTTDPDAPPYSNRLVSTKGAINGCNAVVFGYRPA